MADQAASLRPEARAGPQENTPPQQIDPARRGRTVIADRVVERIADSAVREVGPVARWDGGSGVSKYVTRSLPRVRATVAGQRARVSAQVAIVWPTPLDHAAAQIRDHVRARVQALSGLTVDAVDVRIMNIVVEDDSELRDLR